MQLDLGQKIRELRRRDGRTQEALAEALGVTSQAVSRWEANGGYPDMEIIPSIANYFGISIDELFNFNLYEMEKQVEAICKESWKYRDDEPAKAEEILREGLKRFPGNDNILNNLLYTLDYKTRADEVISLCKTLIESTKYDDVKYDACRMLAGCYKENGQNDLIAPTLEIIPEIYFSKLELEARLLDGEESYEAAQKHKNICADDLVDMLIIIGKHLLEKGEIEKAKSQLKIAQKIIDVFADDFLENKCFNKFIYEYTQVRRKEIEELLAE